MNELKKDNTTIYRLLAVKEEKALIIDCNKVQMPVWKELDFINIYRLSAKDTDEVMKPGVFHCILF